MTYFKSNIMQDTNFYELNQYFWNLPGWIHLGVFLIMLMAYAHLIIGFFMVRKKLRWPMCIYLVIRNLMYLTFFFLKSEDDNFGMLDGFLPVYVMSYIDGLIMLKTHPLMMCKSFKETVTKIFKFNTYVGRNNLKRR